MSDDSWDWAPIAGAAIGAAGSYFGGKEQAEAIAQANELNYIKDITMATHGIRWKVDDAIKAGIHPYVALGAPTSSSSVPFQPVYNPGKAQAFQQIGQGFNQAAAINSQKATPQEQIVDQMNFELLMDEYNKSKGNIKPVPLFIKGYYNKPGEHFMEEAWIYNPDLQTEGAIPTMMTMYANRGRIEKLILKNPNWSIEKLLDRAFGVSLQGASKKAWKSIKSFFDDNNFYQYLSDENKGYLNEKAK
jgi:hypothetical protein